MENSDTTRVNKFVAHATGLSRREVDNAIAAGRVHINGSPAAMGSQIAPLDTVTFDGNLVTKQSSYTYVLFHKPVGYVCSRRRQGEYPTIHELLTEEHKKLKAVGRLDKDSSGIMLLTDDGDLAHRMTHPKYLKQKIYEVSLDKELQPLHQQMINDHGITLEDGKSKLILERLSDKNRTDWKVTMSEGRNRQIRRTFAALGYTVVKLHRTQFGPYNLDTLQAGTFRTLNDH